MIADLIEFIFNGSETVAFDSEEVSQDIIFKNGNENELFVSENGKGFSIQNFKGRSFEFQITPNQKYTTRAKVQRVLELTAVPYTLEFCSNYYLSYIQNFPPNTQPPYTQSPVLQPKSVSFKSAVLSYQNESYEKNRQGRGLAWGLDQSVTFIVMESAPINELFPCANVVDSMFDFSVIGTETPPSSGFWELTDFQFILNGAQNYITDILQYPAQGQYWVSPTPLPIAGNIIDKGTTNNKYNEQLGPFTYATGTVITVQWENVVVQLATGVICQHTTVTKTFTVG